MSSHFYALCTIFIYYINFHFSSQPFPHEKCTELAQTFSFFLPNSVVYYIMNLYDECTNKYYPAYVLFMFR